MQFFSLLCPLCTAHLHYYIHHTLAHPKICHDSSLSHIMDSNDENKKTAIPKLPINDLRSQPQRSSTSPLELEGVHIVETQILLDKDLRPFAVRLLDLELLHIAPSRCSLGTPSNHSLCFYNLIGLCYSREDEQWHKLRCLQTLQPVRNSRRNGTPLSASLSLRTAHHQCPLILKWDLQAKSLFVYCSALAGCERDEFSSHSDPSPK